ncbi:aspartyl-phosphate phosphatase Spo0E family protein [Cohnella nanjingensis]|uniref:Aspartyl-phosphate phosphatase Spo0E family protein n=1 Tax=Cohnella nanjingensis TaxID=1387779 RepID=A0A7X0RM63_9BACL|nr:aspartyl-phosphate phosphatase Spo0E family protein [Cohnella nanjingensis]MBB6670053.1 aspartyl-phosphate phosphatase Spo0E family protein [Cohnella nanjingensis]
MHHLLHKYEEEKRKLNELGSKSLEQGIPLFKNEAVQAQSRKVDELIVQFHQKKVGRGQQLL